jgi:hypothetical protein
MNSKTTRDVGTIESQTSERVRTRAANEPGDEEEIGGIPAHWMKELGLEKQPTGKGSGVLLDLMLAHESPLMGFIRDYARDKTISIAQTVSKLESIPNKTIRDLYFWDKLPDAFLLIAREMAHKFDNEN